MFADVDRHSMPPYWFTLTDRDQRCCGPSSKRLPERYGQKNLLSLLLLFRCRYTGPLSHGLQELQETWAVMQQAVPQ